MFEEAFQNCIAENEEINMEQQKRENHRVGNNMIAEEEKSEMTDIQPVPPILDAPLVAFEEHLSYLNTKDREALMNAQKGM